MTNSAHHASHYEKFTRLIMVAVSLLTTSTVNAFDHSHHEFNLLLKKYVTWELSGHNSTVDYSGFNEDRAIMRDYLEKIAAVSENEFETFNKEEQLAFLINVYNAYTVFWVSQHHENIDSIKDLGSLFNSPWKHKRFSLFGNIVSLAFIEHELIREKGRFDEPRIHMAVNCASISCPALRPHAYRPSTLDAQLHDNTIRFLSDNRRNHLKDGILYISPIFKWYKADFEQRSGSVLEWLSAYSSPLNKDLDFVNRDKIKIKYTHYDWSLNTRRRK